MTTPPPVTGVKLVSKLELNDVFDASLMNGPDVQLASEVLYRVEDPLNGREGDIPSLQKNSAGWRVWAQQIMPIRLRPDYKQYPPGAYVRLRHVQGGNDGQV